MNCGDGDTKPSNNNEITTVTQTGTETGTETTITSTGTETGTETSTTTEAPTTQTTTTTVITKPDAPANLMSKCVIPAGDIQNVNAAGQNQLEVSWSNPGLDTAVRLNWDEVSGISEYKIYRSTTSDDDSPEYLGAVSDTTYLDITCIPDQVYYYTVTSYDGSEESDASNQSEVTPVQTTIANWEVYRGWFVDGNFARINALDLDASATNFNDNGLPSGYEYYYRIKGKMVSKGTSSVPSDPGIAVSGTTLPANHTSLQVSLAVYDINTTANEVTFLANVWDQVGDVVNGLTTTSFTIEDVTGSTAVPLTINSVSSKPINTHAGVCTLDYSQSMVGTSSAIPNMEYGLLAGLVIHKKQIDEYEIIKFSTDVFVTLPFCTTMPDIMDAVYGPNSPPNGSTSLFDAVYQGVEDIMAVPTYDTGYERFVIAFTDGEDNDSVHTMTEVINLAKDNNVHIFSVGYQTGGFSPATEQNLKDMAYDTGGAYTLGDTTWSGLFEMVSTQIDGGYLITCSDPGMLPGGTTKDISITIDYNSMSDTHTSTLTY